MTRRPPVHIALAAAVVVTLSLASCTRTAAAQPSRAATPPAPLGDFTVTYATEEYGAVPGSHIVLVVQSDGSAHMNVGLAGQRLRESATVHLPPSRLAPLAQLLADPAFAHLTSVPPGGEGRTTRIAVHAPRLNVDYQFYQRVPAAARPVEQELQSLTTAVSALLIADQSANGACAVDSDCQLMNCDCHCYAFPSASAVRGGCSPGHCAADPCRGHAVCNPATHRCAMAGP